MCEFTGGQACLRNDSLRNESDCWDLVHMRFLIPLMIIIIYY